VGVLLTSQNRFFLHQSFFNSTKKGKKYDEAADLAYSKDARHYVYAARKGENWFVVVNGKEGPAFDRVVTPVFSPDSRYLIYRARKDGKRFVVVADTGGKTIKQHPAYEQVFQTLITADGKSIAYGVKDGKKLIWKVEKLD
jgi:Tol biopolymer transport system component